VTLMRRGLTVERLDVRREILGDHVPAHLERRRELTGGLGEVHGKNPEPSDRLRAGHRLVRVVHGTLDLGYELRIVGEVAWGCVGEPAVPLLPQLQSPGVTRQAT